MALDVKTLAVLVLLLPLAGSALVGIVGLRWLKNRSHWLVLLGVALALLAALRLFAEVKVAADRPGEVGIQSLFNSISIYHWISAGASSWIDVTLRVDPLTCVMLLTVLGVSLVIVAYSVAYMRDHHGHAERGYERFFAFMGLFVFSMCTLVLAGNFLLLYLGWEMVGLCSYLLIGFYYWKPSAAAAAKKAFIVTRIGDFGFGLGILLIYLTFGTLDYKAVFDATAAAMKHNPAGLIAALSLAPGADTAQLISLIQGRVTVIALLLFSGAVGKSAQIPLYVWLPDAMEGPSPVSALIHAATMVTAGVYMVARCGVIFASSPYALWIVATIGALTAFFSATIALTQFDMKRILAYSTISQLGYMFLGLGVGAFDSAIFHLYTHAFFKALLFLAAGSVMHAMGGVIDIRRFSGLAKGMKVTATTFWIGGLALSGFPLLSGFWSKDEIIHAAMASNMPWLGVLGLVTALLTAFYTFRVIFLAFHGREKLPSGVERARESGPWMTVPLIILAIGAALAGYIGVTAQAGGFLGALEPHGAFHRFLSPVFKTPHSLMVEPLEETGGHGLMYFSALLAILGITTAGFFYIRRPTIPTALAMSVPNAYRLLFNKYYVDEIYDLVFVQPLYKLARFCYAVDRYFINGILWLIAAVPRAIGFLLKGWQKGALQGYALAMIIGSLLMVLWVLIRNAT
ncbi:MAG TPA: NADH-quinone oxidoreductase subunit L [Phycisphaerae bacterium]|nr:NADH-quinone oxidoreductase subunit L [Phycisphaerae bacterium]